MSILFLRIILGVSFSSAIGLIAYWREALTISGVLGAMLVGTAIFGFGGLAWGLVLIMFFVTSTLLSRYKQGRKEEVAAEKFAKGSQRDIWQVGANAGLAALIAIITYFRFDITWMAAFIGAMATVNADTWATELGVLSKTPPRLITTGKKVEAGTSGAISVTGTLATTVGALVIGLAVTFFFALEQIAVSGSPIVPILLSAGSWMVPAALAGGLAGSLCDSLLGATVQAIYYSPHRDKETEKAVDPNGKPNQHIRGWAWMNNDMVNLPSSGVGALVASGTWLIIESIIMRMPRA